MQPRKKIRRRFAAVFAFALLVLLVFLLRSRMVPIVRDMAKTSVSNEASTAINRAVIQQIQDGDIVYDRMVLLEKDMIRLDDAVHEYLPEFKHMKKMTDGTIENVKNTMTLRHLFTMTAGLTYNVDSENIKRGIAETGGLMPTREAMKYIACDPLSFEPGSSWLYSLCHDVLGAVIEVASGRRFGEFVKENIFDPAGMKRSTFLLPEEELPEISAQYRYDSKSGQYDLCSPETQICKFGSAYESGGGGCISTVDDYVAFLEALRTYRLIKPETIARILSSEEATMFI